MSKNFFQMAFDRALNSLQNHIFQMRTPHLTVTLEGKSWPKHSISEKSCFYIMTRRSEKKACRNEIFAEKLASDENNRNVKKFCKNIPAEKSGRQNTKKNEYNGPKIQIFFLIFFHSSFVPIQK